MRRDRAVLQTFRDEQPTQSIFVQDEGRISPLTFKAARLILRLVIGPLVLFEIGNVDASPFFRIPPDKFFIFTPWLAVRLCAGAVINDSPVTRPTEAPAVPEIIPRFARVGLVDAVACE